MWNHKCSFWKPAQLKDIKLVTESTLNNSWGGMENYQIDCSKAHEWMLFFQFHFTQFGADQHHGDSRCIMLKLGYPLKIITKTTKSLDILANFEIKQIQNDNHKSMILWSPSSEHFHSSLGSPARKPAQRRPPLGNSEASIYCNPLALSMFEKKNLVK